jgi:hypothetical protein
VAAVHDQPACPDRRGRLELLIEELAARDPDPVVGRRHVDDVRRVHVAADAGVGEGRRDLGRLAGQHRRLPALRVAQEELHGVRPGGQGLGQRVAIMQVHADRGH